MEAEHEDVPAKVNENAHARKRPVPPTTLDDDEGLARAIELSQVQKGWPAQSGHPSRKKWSGTSFERNAIDEKDKKEADHDG